MLLRSKHFFASFLQNCAATCSIDVILARKRGFFVAFFTILTPGVIKKAKITAFF